MPSSIRKAEGQYRHTQTSASPARGFPFQPSARNCPHTKLCFPILASRALFPVRQQMNKPRAAIGGQFNTDAIRVAIQFGRGLVEGCLRFQAA